MLQTVLRYFCALDKARTALIKETKKIAHAEQESTQQDNSLFGDAIKKLGTYQVETGYNYIDGILQPQYANANLQGSGIAYAVWWWAGQLTWPSPDPVSGALPPVAKWGITWFELLVNFIISTGWYPPLRISGMGSSSVYVPYMSEEGLMQMPSKRAASHMTSAFQSLVQCVQSLSQTILLPVKPRINSAALRRLGYQGKCLTSLPVRPQIPYASETMQFVSHYIGKLDGTIALKLPLDNIPIQAVYDTPEHLHLEFDAGVRYRQYQSIVTKRRKQK